MGKIYSYINQIQVRYGQDIEKILARCDKDMWKIMLRVSASSDYIWPRYSHKTDVYCKQDLVGVMQFDSIPESQSTQEVKGLAPELFKVQVPWD